MTQAIEFFGILMCIGGGFILTFTILLVLEYFLSILWIEVSKKWRSICFAESLIHEYAKERESYMKWKEECENESIHSR